MTVSPLVAITCGWLTVCASASGQTVAEVDGDAIVATELQQAAGQSLATLEEQIYRLKQQQLQQLIGDRLIAHEADRRHATVDALIEAEITSKVAAVTAGDVHALYEANRAQLSNTEDALRPQLERYLMAQKTAARRQEFVESLRAGANVTVSLAAPAPFRAQIHGTGPTRGGADAPVTIVEFEDFQCPFCKQVHQTLESVMARFAGRVRLVHRDFPLDALHPAAWRAHEAARCADDQGRFWEFRDRLYANAPSADADALTKYAAAAGLASATFARCVVGAQAKAAVQNDVSEGERLGVTGTPAFFVNGRLLAGAQSEAEFTRVIEEELASRR